MRRIGNPISIHPSEWWSLQYNFYNFEVYLQLCRKKTYLWCILANRPIDLDNMGILDLYHPRWLFSKWIFTGALGNLTTLLDSYCGWEVSLNIPKSNIHQHRWLISNIFIPVPLDAIEKNVHMPKKRTCLICWWPDYMALPNHINNSSFRCCGILLDCGIQSWHLLQDLYRLYRDASSLNGKKHTLSDDIMKNLLAKKHCKAPFFQKNSTHIALQPDESEDKVTLLV